MNCRVVAAVMLLVLFLSWASLLPAQTTNATITGFVTDPTKAVVVGAKVDVINMDTNIRYAATTNQAGSYTASNLPPGPYRIEVQKPGFKTVVKSDLVLHVQDTAAINFEMAVGSVSETVTVQAGGLVIDTTDATVSTVVDRQFAENLPLNGRSFQSLIQLTPGVVLTANNGYDTGQFSVNGQRANSNYWMVDGVSANIGINAGATAGSGTAGTLGSTSVFGGTNSLVSVDALQEFRIQTSTYAPEFGRQPGAQISIVTRSGANEFHGTAFDYFRNDALDANNWFNGFTNYPPLPKARERQNDFGGTFSGPILKDKTFFFFSYEGLRLQLPQTTLTFVPDTNPGDPYSRQFAVPALLPYMSAFPLPNGPEVLDPNGNHQGIAQFNSTYSDPGTLDAYSLRVDHKINDKLNLFGRYNYSPSRLTQRGDGQSLSTVIPTKITTQTGTLGATWAISPLAANDSRFNYSSTDAATSSRLDSFGGAVPLATLPFPSPFTNDNGGFDFDVFDLGTNQSLLAGANAHNQQRQINIVDSLSIQKGSHSLKFGIDYRRLSPRLAPAAYGQANYFADIPSAETGTIEASLVSSSLPVTFLFRDLGVFAQDTWHIVPRLTMTYGLRWDVDFVPSSISGPEFNAVTGFDLSNLSNLALAPSGTRPYKTRWGNIAPRIGLAYQLSVSQSWQTVLRGGFGVFYDLASSEAGNGVYANVNYPFGSTSSVYGIPYGGTATFPLSPANVAPAAIAPPDPSNSGTLFATDPNLDSPYTLQWNFAVEQGLGKEQSLNVSYIGAAGRHLIQTASIYSPNPNLSQALLVTNVGTSDYNALQLQFQRRLSRGLQALASYSWSHSIDTASAGSPGSGSNALIALNSNINRGPSDFDIRNAFSTGLTYEVPAPKGNAFSTAIFRGWSTENIVQARSAPPVDVYYSAFYQLSNGFVTNVRPDVVPGQPFYLYAQQYPGGKAFNPAAFTPPPLDPVTGSPDSQGDLPRNALRGFGLIQWDFGVHREFPIHESVKLQFRAEMFNVLNHPNFGQPFGNLSSSQFGQSIAMLGQSLAGPGGNLGSGAFDPLYQVGGPRSVQFALKLSF
jgi:hypothetical protein